MDSRDWLQQGSVTVHGVLEDRARAAPQHPFLTADGQVWTLDEINRAANRLAHGLRAKFGVGQGDRVALMMAGSVDYVIAWFAIAKAGAVEVPINTAYKGELLKYIVDRAAPKCAIVDAQFVAEMAAALPQAVPVIVNGAQAGAAIDLRDVPAAAGAGDANPDLGLTGTDPACVIFTSGTTGPSKGVVITHHHEVSFGAFFNEIVSIRSDDVAYNYLPFFHIAAKFLTLGPLLAGARMILVPVFSVSRFWDDVRRHKATICVAVGGLCHMLRSQPERADDADNTLRLIYAVPVPAEFQEEFERRFGVELVEAYGATESNLVVYSRPGQTPRGSCGRASPHFEVAIRDEKGFEVPAGASGEICIRPRLPNTLLAGYLGMPEKTLEVMQDFWFHTGDRGYADADGNIFFQDRIKDSIRRRGENISSFEVERLLNAHPAVAEAAVVGVPSEVGEEDVLAVLVLRTAVAPAALFEFAQATMPYFMVPRFVRFVDQLPRTPTQKIRKIELREQGVTGDTWDCERHGYRIGRKSSAG
ncbi:MAG: AMP-binding protein [Reyranellaceae bacterium]